MSRTGRKIYGIFFLLLITSYLKAQDHTPLCGTDEIHQHALHQNSSYKKQHVHAEQTLFNHTLLKRNNKTTANTLYTIPVVVHIIHNNGTENISDAQVLAALQHMNEAFSNTGSYAVTNGVETGIQFCLAKQDELGNATTGITRHVSPLTNLSAPSEDLTLKNIVRWDPEKYINIWIVNEITSESAGAGVAGYAYFPSSHGTPQDGVVCEALYFGSSVDDSKVLIHELGHYFGLYHTFEGGCSNNNCLLEGDRVCDTPPDASSSPSLCPFAINTCSTDDDDLTLNNPFRPVTLGGLGDQSDMTSNYMDYGLSACRILFTEGQKERMLNAIEGLRASLTESKGCEEACPGAAILDFTPDDTTVLLGATVHFNNLTTGATNYEWFANGTQFSTAQHADYTFNQQGIITITLSVPNPAAGCSKQKSIKIKVLCNLNATFSGPAEVLPTETVTFTNTTTGATSYQWFINGLPVSTSQHFTHSFNAGGYALSMVAYNGQCYDTSRVVFVESASCNTRTKGKIWYFGMWTGLDFSGDTATPIEIPIDISVIDHRSEEASVSMSDANGNYIFFANPWSVFNRNRVMMPNGSGLLGGWSATQMAAVRDPGNQERYYIFTLDDFGEADGLRYSVIDMTLDGGLGDVVVSSKNTPLLTPVTEKATTVKHANGTDTWLLVHENNTDAFYAYLVSASGIGTPVVTHIGSVNTGIGIGQLKFSPDGCKVVSAIGDLGVIEIFTFNNQTGELSDVVSLASSDYAGCYGVEFSPDGSKLYIGAELLKDLYQFDITKTTAADIIASRVLIDGNASVFGLGAFQLGPHGKIYMARTGTKYLGVINNPNAPGLLCDFVAEGQSLGDRTSTNGLPGFPQEYFYDPTPVITGPDTVCANSTNVKYKISGSTCDFGATQWTLIGDGLITSSNDSIVFIDFGIEEKNDTLIVARNSACGLTYDTLFIAIHNRYQDLPDTTLCSGNIVLDPGAGYTSYLWQDNSTSQSFSVTTPGKYWVQLTREGGCEFVDTIYVYDSEVEVSLGPDLARCPGGVTQLNAGSGYTTYEWQDYSDLPTFTAYLPGKYWVTVSNACGNTDSDTIIISLSLSLPVELGDDRTICPGDKFVLHAGNDFESYQWQDNSDNTSYQVSQSGVYHVLVIDATGCYGYDSVRVFAGTDCCDDVTIPTLITPNHDDLNDFFEISCILNKGWMLEVYNRWGQAVYKNKEYNNTWSAEGVSDGVYYYVLRKDDETYKGWVHVVR